MKVTKVAPRQSFIAKVLARYNLLAFTIILAVLISSCGLVPGGKESNATVKQFMQACVSKNVEDALSQFPSIAGGQLRTDIEKLIQDNYVLFEGFQDISMTSINVHYGSSENENDTAEYTGEAKYTGGFKGWVEAELIKIGEEWKLTNIHIDVSEEKLEDYRKRHGR